MLRSGGIHHRFFIVVAATEELVCVRQTDKTGTALNIQILDDLGSVVVFELDAHTHARTHGVQEWIKGRWKQLQLSVCFLPPQP